MANPSSLFRALVVFTLCIFLAVFLGYIVASPFNRTALLTFGLVFLAMAFPFLLRRHALLLIVSWNMNALVFLLPGNPPLWMVMVALSLTFSLSFFALDKHEKFLSVPSVIHPLIFLAVVVLATAQLRGGIQLGSLGGETSGGKRYIFVLAAIVGYFAFACYSIPVKKAYQYGSAYFLGGASAVIGNLIPLVNPAFYFIFAIFPPEQSGLQALGLVQESIVTRFGGIMLACTAVFSALLACYGIRGVFDFSGRLAFFPFQFQGGFSVNRPWRFIIFLFTVAVSLVGGFRSAIVTFSLTFGILFYYERLFRSRLFPALMIVACLGAAFILPMADRLPLSMQRSLSLLSVNVSPVARADAIQSTEWRIRIWQRALPEVPQYLALGKGYAINSGDLSFLQGAANRSVDPAEVSIIAGDYHSGPLTLIIPLGIWGVIGFAWFVIASLRVLSRNYRLSPPELVNLNRFLLVFFIARLIYFFAIFGSFYSDFFVFVGIVGLSTSLNGGLRKKTGSKPIVKEKNAVLASV